MAHNYKVGDKVILLNAKQDGMSGNYKVGNIYTIKTAEESSVELAEFPSGWTRLENIKPYASLVNYEYNPGDKVLFKGKVFEVVHPYHKYKLIDASGQTTYKFADELDVYVEPKFNVGDIVKAVLKYAPTGNWSIFVPIGSEGVIKSLKTYNGKVEYKVVFDNGSSQICHAEHIELVRTPQVKEVTVAELEELYGCKVKVVK